MAIFSSAGGRCSPPGIPQTPGVAAAGETEIRWLLECPGEKKKQVEKGRKKKRVRVVNSRGRSITKGLRQRRQHIYLLLQP